MKKKIISIAMATMLFSVMLMGSGCGIILDWMSHKVPAPKSVMIDGVKYVTGFYRDYTRADESKRENPKTPLFESNLYNFWKLADTEYDLYGATHSHAMGWLDPTIYCREDQLEEVKAYYENFDNATYYFNYHFANLVELPEDCNKVYLNEAIEYNYKLSESSYYDPFEGQGLTKLEVHLSEITYYPVNIMKYSKDRVFRSPRDSGYYYIDGKLYAQKWLRMPIEDIFKENGLEDFKSQKNVFYLLEGESYEYILSLFEEYVLPILKGDGAEASSSALEN